MTDSGTAKRGDAPRPRRVLMIAIVVVAFAIIGMSGCSASSNTQPAATNQLNSSAPSQEGAYWTGTTPVTGTATAPPTDTMTTPSTSTSGQGLSQGDWNQICAGGGCNSGDGLPTFDNGGGLAFSGGGY